MQHSFRSEMMQDISRAIGNLIDGEAAMKRALGRLWHVLEDVPENQNRTSATTNGTVTVNGDANHDSMDLSPPASKENDTAVADPIANRHDGYKPELTPPIEAFFLNGHPPGPENGRPPPFEVLLDGVGVLQELQDDSREYVDRLEEIREGIGSALCQRDALWSLIREKALSEMKEQGS